MTTSGKNIVYMATNAVNGHRYIGVTCQPLSHRWSGHRSSAKAGKKYPLYNALRKYGIESFVIEEIAQFETYEAALSAEIEFIAMHKPEYNITAGGQGVRRVWTPEQIERMRQIKLANPVNFWLGKTRSKDTKAKISRTKTGVPRAQPPAHTLCIFAENMRRAAKARRRKVRCSNTDWVFDSVTDTAKAFGLSKATVAQVCGGKRNSVFGLSFTYEAAP